MADPDIARFLTGLNLQKYVALFHQEEVDWPTLLLMSQEDLEAMGLKVGPVRKILTALQAPRPSLPPTPVDGWGEPPSNKDGPYHWERHPSNAAAVMEDCVSKGSAGVGVAHSIEDGDAAEVERLFAKHVNCGLDYGAQDNIAEMQVTGDRYVTEDWTSWEMMELPEFLLQNIERCQFQQPTPVQRLTIPAILTTQRDVMVSSQTGSGKTAAYLIPTVAMLATGVITRQGAGPGMPSPTVLVIAATHELAEQIHFEVLKMTHRSPQRITCQASHGTRRVTFNPDVDVVVATPGRLASFLQKGMIAVEDVRVVIVDEADRILMLDQGELIATILHPCTHPQRRLFLLSATITNAVIDMAHDLVQEELFVQVGKINKLPAKLVQVVLEVSEDKKEEYVGNLVQRFLQQGSSLLVFANTTLKVRDIAKLLRERCKTAVCELVATMAFAEREAEITAFRRRSCMVLVASDVAAHGLDFPFLEYVINYDVPLSINSYIHRVGRTARAGGGGCAVSFYDDYRDRRMKPYLIGLLMENGQALPTFFVEDVDEANYDVANAPTLSQRPTRRW